MRAEVVRPKGIHPVIVYVYKIKLCVKLLINTIYCVGIDKAGVVAV